MTSSIGQSLPALNERKATNRSTSSNRSRTRQCSLSVEPVSAFDDLVPVGWVRDSVQIERNLLELILEGLD